MSGREGFQPCPFCGSADISVSRGHMNEGDRAFFYGECGDCSALGPPSDPFAVDVKDTSVERWMWADARDGWNRRSGQETDG